MPLTLSDADLAQLTAALGALVSPLDHASVDVWRSSVNSNLKPLLGADSAGFLLPVENGLMLYSDEHDPAELARYQDYPPPPLIDGMSLWERMVRERVGTLSRMYGEHYHLYTRSPYYQEYAGANGAHDTLAASTSLGSLEARGMASMHFWHAKPHGRLFGDRELAILKLLYPAFQAGVDAEVRWGSRRSELLNAIDALGHAVMVCDLAGRVVHQTPALTSMFAADSEATLIRNGIRAALRKIESSARGGTVDSGVLFHAVDNVRTGYARYMLRLSLYGTEPSFTCSAGYRVQTVATCCDRTYILVMVDRLRDPQIPEAQAECWQLTHAERRVGDLLALGKSNKAIATQLNISVHTVRHHVESLLRKTASSSRAAFVAQLPR